MKGNSDEQVWIGACVPTTNADLLDALCLQAVYMGPSKALVSERTRDWTQRFAPLGITVAELTGDTNFHEVAAAKKARIMVTTPEKWDSITRRFQEQQKILSRVRLILIDEVHLLRTPGRGPRLESVIARLKLYGNDIRFLALSATVPNLKDVAEWIGEKDRESGAHSHGNHALPSATVFSFNEEYRTVPLKRLVYGYSRNEAAGYSHTLNKKLMVVTHVHGTLREDD